MPLMNLKAEPLEKSKTESLKFIDENRDEASEEKEFSTFLKTDIHSIR